MPRFVPHEYQSFALRWLIEKTVLSEMGGAGLFLDPGLGKTSIVLAWIRALKALGLSRKVLIIAPLRVVYSVWPREVEKWDQFRSLKVSIVHGSPTKRMKAIATDADIYLTTPQSLPMVWDLFSIGGTESIPFDALVVDESTLFKNWGAKRKKKKARAPVAPRNPDLDLFPGDESEEPETPEGRPRLSRMQALKKMLPAFRYRVILTGTPRAEGLQDLFSQVFILDQGKTFGPSISKFRNRYFFRGGFGGYQYFPNSTAEKLILEKVRPICLSMSREDHLDLPELLTNDIWIDLPGKAAEQYRDMEKKLFLTLDDVDVDATPLNAGARYLACRQIANGGIYDPEDPEKIHHLHMAKVETAADIVAELNGKPALIAFQFRHDLERLRKHWKNLPSIDGRCSGRQADKLVDQWNAGELERLAVQPKSLSHGVNMQSGPGRDMIFIGLDDSLETYLQIVARLYRQGVEGQVRIHRILARKTVDEMIVRRIENKDESQRSFLESLKSWRAGAGR